MADEVPAQGQVGRFLHFQQRFLYLILAELELAGFGRGANMIDAERL
jgi:hypothetical protein